MQIQSNKTPLEVANTHEFQALLTRRSYGMSIVHMSMDMPLVCVFGYKVAEQRALDDRTRLEMERRATSTCTDQVATCHCHSVVGTRML
jgi:hypothetical protein